MDVSDKLPAIKGTTYVVEVTTTGSTQLGIERDTDELYYSVEAVSYTHLTLPTIG